MNWWQTLLTSVVPVLGVLAGAFGAQRGEINKRRDERAAAAEASARETARAAQQAREQNITHVLTAGVAWRSDLAAMAIAYRFQEDYPGARPIPESMLRSHRDFGTAVQTALTRVDDQAVINALNDCGACFNEGFDLLRDVTSPRQISGVPHANRFDAVTYTLGARLTTLQEAARMDLAPSTP